jgi:hypothetical protein
MMSGAINPCKGRYTYMGVATGVSTTITTGVGGYKRPPHATKGSF